MNINRLVRIRECKICHRLEWRAYKIYRHIKNRHKVTGFTKHIITYN